MRVVENETALLLAVDAPCYFLRLKHEHTTVIHSRTGELYEREDGQPWAQGGYFVTRKRNDPDTLEIANANGYCDHTVYRNDRANAA